jgi:hypothetical protein
MKYSISLIENDTDIRNSVLQSLQGMVNKALDTCILKIRSPLSDLIKAALVTEPEYSSLKSGLLRAEFGIEDSSKVDVAVDNISKSIIIEKRNVIINNLGLSGGIDLKLINNENYGGALSDESGMVVDSNRGYSLPWLEWLLLKGNSIIVRNYNVKYGQNPRSRSGDAIMIDSTSNWRVPPEFAGTTRDNWTTRALNRVDKDINRIIQQSFESSI